MTITLTHDGNPVDKAGLIAAYGEDHAVAIAAKEQYEAEAAAIMAAAQVEADVKLNNAAAMGSKAAGIQQIINQIETDIQEA